MNNNTIIKIRKIHFCGNKNALDFWSCKCSEIWFTQTIEIK